MLNLFHRPGELNARCDQGVLDPNCHVETDKFHDGIGSLDLLRSLRISRQMRRPLSLNVQLPSNLRPALCSPRGISCEHNGIEHYLQRLLHEIDLVGCHLGTGQRVEQFHLGGGTPIIAHLKRLMSQLRERFNFLDHEFSEYSVEVDLHHTDWSTMGVLRDLGFNHVSIGVPDIDADSDMSVDCYQNPAPIHSLIDAARTFGYRSINVDLGYGHAWQTPESFALKLATLVELEPDRLLVFDYSRPPQRYRAMAADTLKVFSSEDDKGAMREICFEQLLGAGYHYIGLGQFVRPDDDLAIAQERGRLRRNCEGFTRYGYCDHIGFGLGAISQIDDLYAQNTDELERYQQCLDMDQLPTSRGWRCEAGSQVRQMVTERMACDLELDVQSIERRYGLIFRQYFYAVWPVLEQLASDGLIELSDRFISILPAGRPHVDAICNLFEKDSGGGGHEPHSEWIDHDDFI
ncbi:MULTISPECIES: coproporphyrinogen III oxidase [unclassified Pseudomonas]|uniref:coproporphyrinogen III oxidase n=1 Tax=unclassified Pseudomonas TaxID=196821 RepID=UPI002AC8F632|nr:MULTISPECIES: coproporphyrinogen III oxidase [unclassified Pseudomonas]MEB0046677.1 coproporphyrinogen III oxidase [Pseudomonas sp. Dout3]MEB0098559.1 coproporphyrinogen III oxidase [Pseudomonas sp. DC1.2]WPX56666.1 coproporphyrinogen III oxidase [Pseudomonas sp. DC1.2]